MIRKGSYGSMSWVDALAARTKTIDLETELATKDEKDAAGDALQKTAAIAFGPSSEPKGPDEALRMASVEIQDKLAASMTKQAADEIKSKLAIRGIDPVALGVIKKQEWEETTNLERVGNVCEKAALEYEKGLSREWEARAMSPSHAGQRFDPETSKEGKVMSAANVADDTVQPSRVPANANSILDPNRLDALAAGINEHDESVKAAKARQEGRKAEKKEALAPKDTLEPTEAMNAGRVIRAGGEDASIFVHKVPKDQISMLDDLGKPTSQEDLRRRLGELFTSKIPDNGGMIKKAAEERKEAIQGKKEKDRSWETASKPTSTSDLAKKLMDLWHVPQK